MTQTPSVPNKEPEKSSGYKTLADYKYNK